MDLPEEWKWLDVGSPSDPLGFRWALSLIDTAHEPLRREVVDRIIAWPANVRSLNEYFEMWEFDPSMILPQLAGTPLLGNVSCELYSSSQAPFWEWLGIQKFVALQAFAMQSYEEEVPTAVIRSSWFQSVSHVSLRLYSQASLHQIRVAEWVRAISKVRSTRFVSLDIDASISELTSPDTSVVREVRGLSENIHVEIQISETSEIDSLRELSELEISDYSICAHDLTSIAALAENCPREVRKITLKECAVDVQSLNRLCNAGRFPQLTSLVIDDCTLDVGAGIADVSDLTSTCLLSSVTCSGDFDFTTVIAPTRLPNLEVLDLSHSNGDRSTVDRILQLPNKERLRHLAVSSSFNRPFSVSSLFSTTWENLQVFKVYKQVIDHEFITGMLHSFRSGYLRFLEIRHSDELAPGIMTRLCESPAMANVRSIFFPFSWPTLDDAIHFCRSEMASQLHSLLLFDTPPGTREDYLRALIDESRLSRLVEWTVPFLGQWDAGLARAAVESPLVHHLDMIRADSHSDQFREVFLDGGQIRKVLKAIIERW